MKKTNNNSSILRTVRKIHRLLATTSFLLLLVISVTGILLGWKKHTGDFIQPEIHEGISVNTSEWLSFDSLKTVAMEALHNSAGPGVSTALDRIDARPSKGMVKFIFTDHYWEVQVDAATGDILHVSKRNSDIIENIHDGSILDHLFRTREGYFKLIYLSHNY